MKLLAVVPAKFDSERLPGKNRTLVAGRTLVQHALDYLEICKQHGVDLQIVLATDSEEMRSYVTGEHHIVVSPARGRAVLDVLNAVQQWDDPYDVVGMFLPTAPLRKISYLKECMVHLGTGYYDGAVTVSAFDFPPQLAIAGYGPDDLDLHFPVQYITDDTRTQDQGVSYRPNGVCYVASREMFLRSGNFFSGKVRGVLVPRSDMIDIDYQEDLTAARKRLRTWRIDR